MGQCEICGAEGARTCYVMTGNDSSVCRKCIAVWYDKGLRTREEILAVREREEAADE